MRVAERGGRIAGTGRHLPDRVVTNAEMETIVETSDEWIRTRTGIRERRLAPEDVSAADMGAEAAKRAMCEANVSGDEIDLVLVSTATPDRLLPSTACDIQAILGTRNAAAYDFASACSGFLYGLSLAQAHIVAEQAETVLVICTEKMSSIVDWGDRRTSVLFGDGAGAAVVRRSDPGEGGILSSFMKSDGTLAELLYRPAGGARIPMDVAVLEERSHLVKMAGPEVFRSAVRSMCEAADEALRRAAMTSEDIDFMIPHQANMRIIDATAKYAGIPMEKVIVNVDRYGNMSSASVPVALDEARESGVLGQGSVVLMVAFGAGFTWAANVVRL
ncbi:MAG: beta-ketoacyl-ACP synthase III [Gemmatimonas sp.]|nr:beta-ketoacyl-ACP synthase III [Gemmatimonas sp.]